MFHISRGSDGYWGGGSDRGHPHNHAGAGLKPAPADVRITNNPYFVVAVTFIFMATPLAYKPHEPPLW